MRARKAIWLALLATGILGSGSAMAVSDGGFSNQQNGCTSDAYNSDSPDRAEKGCYALVYKIYDGKGHTYFSVGIPETPEGTGPNALIGCLDVGAGTKECIKFSKNGARQMPSQPGTQAHPESGVRVYFGANDNLSGGEHDSSSQVNNGPSDGGAIQANIKPGTIYRWLAAALHANKSYVLTHPLPGVDAGAGACADGLCFSVQTQRRVAYQGTGTGQTDAANYGGKEWDPKSCSGATGNDGPDSCGGQPISYWEEKNGTTYVEPGIQIYEDPDPQGSPIGPYPIPALYLGTCGFIAGGGPVTFPASPFTNDAGQIVVATGC